MKKKSTSKSAPASHSSGEGGFFNLGVLVRLFIALVGVFLALLVLGMYPAKSGFAQTRLSATDSPEEEDPGAREAWERLRLQDEHGRIPPNALINAYEQKKAMSFHPEAWGEFLPGGWSPIGPGNVGGRIRSMIIHPTIPGTIWVGSLGGGVWKTTNGGTSWITTTDFMANLVVACMAIDPTNPNVLYAGTGESVAGVPGAGLQGNGIFKTSDGGSSWTQLRSTANNPNFYWVNRLAISPTDRRTLLAATETGISVSIDGGGSWYPRPRLRTCCVRDVRFHPSDGTKCIAGDAYGHAYYSTDGGVTWPQATWVNVSPTPAGRVELAYAKSDPTIVYAQAGIQSPGDGKLFRSTDGGKTYALKNGSYAPPPKRGGRWYNALWVDPTNANTLVVGAFDLWRSTNGGTNLEQISDSTHHPLSGEPDSVHCDHHVIVNHPDYNGTSNTIVYFGNDGGIYRTDNVLTVAERSGWVSLNHDLGITQFYGAAGNPASGTIIGGTQDNGTVRYSAQGGSNGWTMMKGADGGFCAADQTDPNYFYGESQGLGIYRSTNGGNTANYIIDGNPPDRIDRLKDARKNANFVAPFVLDPNNPNTLLAGGQSLWRSTNVKAPTPSWTPIKEPITSSGSKNISAIAVAKGNSDIIWVGHNNGKVYYTQNGTAARPDWSPAPNGLPVPERYCTRLTIDPQNSNVVYATLGGFAPNNVWKTTGHRAPWENISNGLPSAPVFSLVVSPSNSRALYIGTAVGVFASADGGATWSRGNDGPANAFVEELFWMGPQLVAATHGRGMFTAGIPLSSRANYR
jgi:photosystem II stability/assembly factor-like uncharacterized protein